MGTNVRSADVSASRRYKLLVSTPRKTYSPVPGSAANWTKTWRSCSASILPSIPGFIQTGPTSREQRRERQLGKAVGCRFTRERIHRVEQRIACLLEAPTDRVTKFVQRVKVHREHAPPCFSFGGTLLLQAILCKRGLPEVTLV